MFVNEHIEIVMAGPEVPIGKSLRLAVRKLKWRHTTASKPVR